MPRRAHLVEQSRAPLFPQILFHAGSAEADECEDQREEGRTGNSEYNDHHVAVLDPPIHLRVRDSALCPGEIEIEICSDGRKAVRRNRTRRPIGYPRDYHIDPSSAHTSSSVRNPPGFEEPRNDCFSFSLAPSPSPRQLLIGRRLSDSPDIDEIDETERQCVRREHFVDVQRLPAKKHRDLGKEAVRKVKEAMKEGSTKDALFWMLQAEIHQKEMDRLNQLAAFSIFRGMCFDLYYTDGTGSDISISTTVFREK